MSFKCPKCGSVYGIGQEMFNPCCVENYQELWRSSGNSTMDNWIEAAAKDVSGFIEDLVSQRTGKTTYAHPKVADKIVAIIRRHFEKHLAEDFPLEEHR